ncbi:MAG TPA: response regulator transcription factor [Chryseosolibacter sp.]
MIRVFIVDDHPMVIEGLRTMLLELPEVEVTGHAMNAASCIGYFIKNDADVVLLDINLPDGNGMEVCKQLLQRKPHLKVIALTNHEQISYLQGMKDAGAKGYLLKNASVDKISKALQTVQSGDESWLGNKSLKDSLATQSELLLTRREIEVLRLIAEGLTNQQIADRLFVSASTIDSHRKNLISKLQVKNTAALVRAAFEKKIL